jgi:hypothetical protein
MTRALRAAAATLAVAAFLPAGAAQAADGKSVARALDRAETLTERAVALAERGADARAARTVKQARRAVTVASRDARRMAAKARSVNRRLDAAGALALVAARLGEDVEAYAGALDESDGRAESALAGALPGTVASHDAVVDALEALVAKLPPEHRAIVEQVVAAIVAEWPKQLDALAEAAFAGDLPTAVSGVVKVALGSATFALREALTAMQAVVATLPAPAQAAIGQALQHVQPLLDTVLGIVGGVSKVVTAQIGSVVEMVTELVGSLVPPAVGAVDGSTDGDTPSLGGLFDGIPLVGELLDGLPIIGGLLGGR